jgi:hypothetical protein
VALLVSSLIILDFPLLQICLPAASLLLSF